MAPVQIPQVPQPPVQILDVLEPVQIPLVPQSPVQIPVSHVLPEPPVQIPVSQVPESPVQIPVSQVPEQVPQSPVQIPDVPEHVQIPVSQVPQPPMQILHVSEPPVQIPHVSEPVQIPDVPEPVQIPVSQVPQPPEIAVVHMPEPADSSVSSHSSTLIFNQSITHNHLCRFYMYQNLCKFQCHKSHSYLCRFSQSSTFWTLWSRQMHSTSSCRLIWTPRTPDASHCTLYFDGNLFSFLDEFERAPKDLTMPRLNSCVKKSIGPIQPMDRTVNSCL
ncbi:hypothetical protein TNCV_360811 [Trichonephila clavipes]|nr:hypothetical protein TNCV_360811 [Trichonephila clavipes]